MAQRANLTDEDMVSCLICKPFLWQRKIITIDEKSKIEILIRNLFRFSL